MVLRARGDIRAAVDAGRFTVRDLGLAMVTVVGAALCLGQLLHDHPDMACPFSIDRSVSVVMQYL